jgi:hypothetical protein
MGDMESWNLGKLGRKRDRSGNILKPDGGMNWQRDPSSRPLVCGVIAGGVGRWKKKITHEPVQWHQ